MVKESIEILDFEDKETKAGKSYTRFKTSAGWLSCFDNKSIPQLKQKTNQGQISVDLIDSGEFKNIKKFLGESKPESEKVAENDLKPLKNNFPDSMRVAYAKDVLVGIIGRISQQKFDDEFVEDEKIIELAKMASKAVKFLEKDLKFP